jgi:MFS family permease
VPDAPLTSGTVDYTHPTVRAHQRRNLWLLAAYQIVIRVGWIFKTESVIMPAFLDRIDGSGWMRGCLPALNRIGQSVPPVLYARRLAMMPLKRASLLSSTLAMAAVFIVLAVLWHYMPQAPWLPIVVLVLYGVFFSVTGLNQVALSTLQGKLIEPTRRGYNLLISSAFGAVLAVLAAWWLLGDWLVKSNGGFDYIFGFTGLCFVASAVAIPLLVEPPDKNSLPRVRFRDHFTAAWRTLRRDKNFRRLAVVAMLFGTVLNLFPHYQKFAFDRFNCPTTDIVWWVIIQNIGVGLYSFFAGPVADRRGNRLVLRWLAILAAAAPVLAVGLTYVSVETAQHWFWVVFLLLGLTPITMRTLYNYTLEISPVIEHPRYLSTLSLCMAVPLMFAPLTGELTGTTSFEAVFLSGAGLILLGGLLTFRLAEPRRRAKPFPGEIEPIGDDSTFPGGAV